MKMFSNPLSRPVLKPLAYAMTLALSNLLVQPVMAAEVAATEWQITAVDLTTALHQLSYQSGQIIVAPGRLVGQQQVKPFTGKMSLPAALQQLLQGTGLLAVRQPNGSYVIQSQPNKQAATQSQPKTVSQTSSTVPMEVIMVTASKRATSVLDVAASMAVLSAEQLKDAAVKDFSGLFQAVPGVSINSAFGGPQNSFITIRGIGGADDYKPNGNPSVALHVDGIYQTSNAYLAMPLFDIERLEVLKGPQGTLYGRNTTAGTINAITRKPGAEFDGYASVDYGSFQATSAEAAFGGAVTDQLGLRLAVKMEQGGGYMTGMGAGRFAGFAPKGFEKQIPAIQDPGQRDGFGDKDLFALRATSVYQFSSATDLTLRYFFSADQGDTLQYDRIAYDAESNAGKLKNAGEDSDPYRFYSDEYYRHDISISGVQAELIHQLSADLQFNTLLGHQQSDRKMGGNGDGTPYQAYKYLFDEELSQSSLEIRLSDSTGGDFDWLAGAFLVTDTVDFQSDWTSFDVRSVYRSPYQQSRNSAALFSNLDWYASNDWKLSAGLRFTRDNAKFSGHNQDLNPWGTSIYSTVFKSPSYFSWDRDFSDQNLSAKLTAQYYLTDSSNLYASVSNGYRGGGFDGTSIFSLEETMPFDSETVVALEAGYRYSGDTLNASLDAFGYNFKEMQATTRLSNDTNGRANVGAAEVRGLEAALSATLWSNTWQQLSLDSSVSFVKSEITEFSSNRISEVTNTIGDQLPGAPELTYQLTLSHHYNFSDGSALRSRLSYMYHDEESNRLNAEAGNITPAYGLVNLHLDWQYNEALLLSLYGRNITDKVYFLELNAGSRLVGAPASYGLGLKYSF
jgi:outer membrane receptor protein involved in Fe transport